MTLPELENLCKKLTYENIYLRELLGIPPSTALESPEKALENIPPDNSATETNELSPNKKIALFRSLFLGREDVHAVRWENKQGRSGYSPACPNEWDKRLCRKPKIKCSECPNSQWLPITDQVIYDHLIGKKFIGIYPLASDETCRFLALDFDKNSWKEDADAFMKICRSFTVPALIERSQSGNGAHVWIFFSESISARIARSLGTALITQTMRECHSIKMESYDRLFPNQDTLPKGGFGNLIALPLQGQRRKEANTVFLNEALEPHPDQWGLLSSIKPLTQAQLLTLLNQFEQHNGLLDIKMSQTDEDQVDPWISSKLPEKYPTIEKPLPSQLDVVLSNLLYVPFKELPTLLINHIKKIAAFQNPEFYKAQAMRLSIYETPRIINCSEHFENHIGLPRGSENELLELLSHYKINVNIHDQTQQGETINVTFNGELRPEQQASLEALLPHCYGVLAATTAFGKTVVAAKLIAERKTNTLILVHRQQLLEQWQERLSSFLGVPAKFIGTLGGGRNKLTGVIDIAMLQSLSKKGIVREEITHYGQVIIDECHHLSAVSFEKVLKKSAARYVLGLTATPIRKDGHHPIIMMQCGPIRYRFSNKNKISLHAIEHRVSVRHTGFQTPYSPETLKITDLYSALSTDEARNEQIFNDVLLALESGRKPLLLTERKKHLIWFEQRFSKFVKNIFVLHGNMKPAFRKAVLENLSKLPKDDERLIIATGSYIGEGFDDPLLDTLFLTLPISWHGTLQQYVGRLHRIHENKKDILVYDYVDEKIPVFFKMYQKRLKKYSAMGYKICN